MAFPTPTAKLKIHFADAPLTKVHPTGDDAMGNYIYSHFFACDFRRIRGPLAFVGIVIAQLALGVEVYAQSPVPRPTVTRAIDVFDSRPERVTVGNRVALKIKNTPEAKRVVRAGLQVRVFSLRDDQSRPSPITTIGECDVFLAVVLRIEAPDESEAIVPTLDHGWLTLTDSLNSIKSGKYFFVFEQRGPDSEQFRLKSTDYKNYFDTGFQLIVDQRDGVSLEAVRSAYFERRDRLGRLNLEIDDRQRSVPCYTYRRLVAEVPLDNQMAQLSLDYCERGFPQKIAM